MNKLCHFIRARIRTDTVRSLCSNVKHSSQSTVDQNEIAKFSNNAEDFWGKKYQLLHDLNTLRVPLVRDGILSATSVTRKTAKPLTGYKIIDVGCGGGILSEPLARLGATVTGLDPGAGNIEVAKQHALKDKEIKDRLSYVCDTVENAAVTMKGEFDAVVCSEVVEHVADVPLFVRSCVELAKDGGSLFFTTINRTTKSYFIAIFMAEYVFGFIPRGTHEWNKFVKPEELQEILEATNCHIVSVEGILYDIFSMKWSWCNSNEVGYALHAIK